MIYAAIPPVARWRRRVRVPSSKSFTNRALLLAAISPGPFTIRAPLDCDDSDSMVEALSAAGVSFRRTAEGWQATPGPIPPGEITLDVRESGTACRFLAAFAATSAGGNFRLTGSPRLLERPVRGLVRALRALGADIEYIGREGFPPLAIRGRELAGGEVAIDAGESSQYVSALLMVSTRLPRGLHLRMEGEPVSRPYIATTCEALAAVGVAVEASEGWLRVAPGETLRRLELRVPADASSAVPLAAAVAIAGGEMELSGFDWPSTQADAAAIGVLGSMGLSLSPGAGGLAVSGRACRPVSVRASDFPDAVPALAAVAARVAGESVFSGVEHLKIKESDRIAAILDLLDRAGCAGSFRDGALRVTGSPGVSSVLPVFPTRSDHRIVMAACLLSLSGGGLVESPRAVAKSYPGFLTDLFG